MKTLVHLCCKIFLFTRIPYLRDEFMKLERYEHCIAPGRVDTLKTAFAEVTWRGGSPGRRIVEDPFMNWICVEAECEQSAGRRKR